MIKKYLRKILRWLHLDVTKNMRYDRYTSRIMQSVLLPTSNCIDVGAHEGEVLGEMLALAPKGKHFAFEPLPHLHTQLSATYGDRVNLFSEALSDHSGEGVFHHVVNAPAYSGLRKRDYDHPNPDITQIYVKKNTLDELILPLATIDFIKIDVEGAELAVLRGATSLIQRDQPLIIFEFGRGASEHYHATPKDLYKLLNMDLKMDLYTLKDWLDQKDYLSEKQLVEHYELGTEYYFLAKHKAQKV